MHDLMKKRKKLTTEHCMLTNVLLMARVVAHRVGYGHASWRQRSLEGVRWDPTTPTCYLPQPRCPNHSSKSRMRAATPHGRLALCAWCTEKQDIKKKVITHTDRWGSYSWCLTDLQFPSILTILVPPTKHKTGHPYPFNQT